MQNGIWLETKQRMKHRMQKWFFAALVRDTARVIACWLDTGLSGAEILQRSYPYLRPAVRHELSSFIRSLQTGDATAVSDAAGQLLRRCRSCGQRAILLCNALYMLYFLSRPVSARPVFAMLQTGRRWGCRHVRHALVPMYAAIEELSGRQRLLLLIRQTGSGRRPWEYRLRKHYTDLLYTSLQNPLERENVLQHILQIHTGFVEGHFYRCLLQAVCGGAIHIPDTGAGP